jgi:hypothetical protein
MPPHRALAAKDSSRVRAQNRALGWRLFVAVALMLVAIFAYVASLDESDPEALPAAAEQVEPGTR